MFAWVLEELWAWNEFGVMIWGTLVYGASYGMYQTALNSAICQLSPIFDSN